MVIVVVAAITLLSAVTHSIIKFRSLWSVFKSALGVPTSLITVMILISKGIQLMQPYAGN